MGAGFPNAGGAGAGFPKAGAFEAGAEENAAGTPKVVAPGVGAGAGPKDGAVELCCGTLDAKGLATGAVDGAKEGAALLVEEIDEKAGLEAPAAPPFVWPNEKAGAPPESEFELAEKLDVFGKEGPAFPACAAMPPALEGAGAFPKTNEVVEGVLSEACEVLAMLLFPCVPVGAAEANPTSGGALVLEEPGKPGAEPKSRPFECVCVAGFD